MLIKCHENNNDILIAKGSIPYWVIASQIDVHENTVRNWMKREMLPVKKAMILRAIEEIKEKEMLESR